MGRIRMAAGAFVLAGVLALWGCDRGDASAPARDHSSAASSASHSSYSSRSDDRPHPPAPLLDGKPMWADNREHTAQENVDYQFDHWGSGFGAHDAKDYAKKARGFIDHPPKGVEKMARGNGDVMLYDKVSNTMAIVRRDGAPRLYRKPPGGEADWTKAKSEAANGGGRYRSRSRYGSGGSASD